MDKKRIRHTFSPEVRERAVRMVRERLVNDARSVRVCVQGAWARALEDPLRGSWRYRHSDRWSRDRHSH